MKLQTLIDGATNLPSVPKIIQELIESFSNDDFDIDEIAKKVSQDQALTAKVLRLANSAKFGGNRTIGSVNDAIVRMGFDALRTLVLASGLTSTFKSPPGFDLKNFWRRSFMVANRAKWVANYTKENSEVAFTCGMIHAIGDLLLHILLPDQANDIDSLAQKGASKEELQKNQLGFDYTEAGEELAIRWKFPKVISDAIRWQNHPEEHDEEGAALACVVTIAIYLTNHAEEDKQTLLESFPSDLGNTLGINLVEMLGSIDQLDDIDAGIDELIS